jgi:hypothetical protein
MAIVKKDPNDLYGETPNGGRDVALQGIWTELSAIGGNASSAVPRMSTAEARTGSRSWYFPSTTPDSFNSTQANARMGFGSSVTQIGLAFGILMPNLFTVVDHTGWSFRDIGNAPILTFVIQTDGSIQVKRGNAEGTLLGTTSTQMGAGAWRHVEVFAVRDATVGAVEIRIEGVTVLNLTGVNTGAANWTQVHFGTQRVQNGITTMAFYLDDVIVWDKTGTQANDFLGPVGLWVLLPDADTAAADWVVNGAASGNAALSEVPPDGDTSYIESTVVGDISEFDCAALPVGTIQIAAVIPVALMRSAEAAPVRLSVVSGVDVAPGADRYLTTDYAYHFDPIHLDPATGAPWTEAAVNAARLRLTALAP